MLPVLFTLVLQPAWAPWALLGAAALLGAWQSRAARAGGEPPQKALRTGLGWAAGSFAAGVAATFLLGEPGNNNLFGLQHALRVPLHTYGLLVATAFLLGMWLAARAARRAGLDEARILDLTFWILVAAMIGSRVLFVIVNWDDFAREPGGVFAFWKGGLVFYGGFIGAVLCAVVYMRRHGMGFFAYADALIPSVAIGHAVGRLGCFAAGCCWGGACDAALPWAARFPPESLAYQSHLQNHLLEAGAPFTGPIHPTQLYESLGALCIFVVLTLWRPRKRTDGELLGLYLVLYAPLRSLVETFRGDEERGRVLNFLGAWARHAWWNPSTSEFISIGIFAAGVVLLVTLGRRARAAPAAA